MKQKKNNHDAWAEEIAALGTHLKNLGDQAQGILKQAETRYQELDPQTKKKIKAGMVALETVAALAVAKKAKKKK